MTLKKALLVAVTCLTIDPASATNETNIKDIGLIHLTSYTFGNGWNARDSVFLVKKNGISYSKAFILTLDSLMQL
jgi:hypothetical protein